MQSQNLNEMTLSLTFVTEAIDLLSYDLDATQHEPNISQSVAKLHEKLELSKCIGEGRFPVFLTFSFEDQTHYALKAFELEEDEPHPRFQNETRFTFLDHPNIIQIYHTEEKTCINSLNGSAQVSCILTEYAPNGDFNGFLRNYRQHITDKILRTYFRQLIEGLEYMHDQGVYHLDLKLRNLLLSQDYQLKIADFDLSSLKGDAEIFSKGSKFYRAPEVKSSECTNGSAADIYSAGVILFILKSGGIAPHAEDQLYEGIDLQAFKTAKLSSKHIVKHKERRSHSMTVSSESCLYQ